MGLVLLKSGRTSNVKKNLDKTAIMEIDQFDMNSQGTVLPNELVGGVVDSVVNSVSFSFQLHSGVQLKGIYDNFVIKSHRTQDGRVKFIVDLMATRIEMRDSKMNAQLHSTEFLSSLKYPIVQFESTALVRDKTGSITLFGLLSLRNVIREIAVQVVSVNLVFDQNQRMFEQVHFRSWIDRRLWGLQSSSENSEDKTPISHQMLIEGIFHRRILNVN